jgi:hypothetical protein
MPVETRGNRRTPSKAPPRAAFESPPPRAREAPEPTPEVVAPAPPTGNPPVLVHDKGSGDDGPPRVRVADKEVSCEHHFGDTQRIEKLESVVKRKQMVIDRKTETIEEGKTALRDGFADLGLELIKTGRDVEGEKVLVTPPVGRYDECDSTCPLPHIERVGWVYHTLGKVVGEVLDVVKVQQLQKKIAVARAQEAGCAVRP